MKIKTFLADYFSFNRAEQRGISVFLAIFVILLAATRFWPDKPMLSPAAAASFRKEVEAFSAALKAEEEKEQLKRKSKKSNYIHFPVFRYDTTGQQARSRGPAYTIEMNGADTLELQRLRGIGSGFARRIVGYRNKLGGYIRKQQLLEVYGMDEARYRMIEGYITVNADSVRKIDINNVPFKSLMSHPYFPYDLTREIILYRKKVKRFNQAEELKNVNGVTDSVYRKISPYIVVR